MISQAAKREDSLEADVTSSPSPDRSSGFSQPRTTRIYICGFIEKRLHNAALYQIANDLLSRYYVATNPCNQQKWSHSRTASALADSDILIFLLNEFTLRNYCCLRTLQYAHEMHIPLLIIRNPRMRLVMTPILEQRHANGLSQSQHSSSNGIDDRSSGTESPNMFLLQDVVYEGYKTSVEYDKLQHDNCMRKIYQRISELRRIPSPPHPSLAKDNTHLNYIPDLLEMLTLSNNKLRSNKDLHLPVIHGHASHSSINHHHTPLVRERLKPNHLQHAQPLKATSNASNAIASTTTAAEMRKRSQSFHANGQAAIRLKRQLSQSSSVSQNNASGDAVTTSNDSRTPSLTLTFRTRNQGKERSKSEIEDELGLNEQHNHLAMDDPYIFHKTQYLVFPLRHREQKPRLVKFPEDLFTSEAQQNAMEMESLWGSDSSLANETELAGDLQGNLDFSLPSTPPPAASENMSTP